MVNTAGSANCNFSIVIACNCREKSKGVMENFVTFCSGFTNAFFAIRTVSIFTPVIAR